MFKQSISLLRGGHTNGSQSHAAVVRTLSNNHLLKVDLRMFSSTAPTQRILELPGEVISAPRFTEKMARKKVKAAQDLWNTRYVASFADIGGRLLTGVNIMNHSVDSIRRRDPEKIVKAYTEHSIWRNRDQFLAGHSEIVDFLTKKWEREKEYRLRKELFCWHDEKIAVQFWYEYRDALDGMKWKRCYGLEDWTFDVDGRMRKRQMSGNDVELKEGERWFVDGKSVEEAQIGEKHW